MGYFRVLFIELHANDSVTKCLYSAMRITRGWRIALYKIYLDCHCYYLKKIQG